MRRLFLKYSSLLKRLKLKIQNFESVLDFSMLEICYATVKDRLKEVVS
jgi:hypothetical protein